MHTSDIAETLEHHYPRTVAAFRSMGALDQLERIVALDAAWAALRADAVPGASASQTTGLTRWPAWQANVPATTRVSHFSRLARKMRHIQKLSTLLPQAKKRQLPAAPDYSHGAPGTGAPAATYDLIYAGGGLGLLHAAVMARYGYRVLLFDRGEAGCAHREWNISRPELAALVNIGLCSWDELRDVIMAEYTYGVVRFHAPEQQASELRLHDVLDVALDAGALLRLVRRKLIEAGGVVLDRHSLRGVVVNAAGPSALRVELAAADGAHVYYWAQLLLDGMGSASPLALQRFAGRPFAGVCPTVGTVATGFTPGHAADEHTPHIGDILISVADAQRGQQYMWEGFPGRGDDLTVYLFYYDTLVKNREPRTKNRQADDIGSRFSVLGSGAPNLMQLFEDYFTLLPSYKRPGHGFWHRKPVYGYIPARHSLRRQEAPLLRGVLPIGDSAAQQSPLTFCGFGSHVRNLARTTSLLHTALQRRLTEPAHLAGISAYQANVSLNWVFSRFMQPWATPGDVNRLQNLFLGVLNELGEDLARRFFRDEMRWGDYHRMVLGMFRHYPPIVWVAWRVLGPLGIARWVAGYLAYCRTALAARCARRLGVAGRAALLAAIERVNPVLALRLRAAIGEWQVMRWL